MVRSDIVLLKYWFSVSDAEQERRFQERAHDPLKRWKPSPMDLKSREKWVEFSKAGPSVAAASGRAHRTSAPGRGARRSMVRASDR